MTIEELKRLEQEATEGEWELNLYNPLRVVIDDEKGQETVAVASQEKDAALIVALRNAAPALIQVAECAEKYTEMMFEDPIDRKTGTRALWRKKGTETFESLRAALAALRGGEGGK